MIKSSGATLLLATILLCSCGGGSGSTTTAPGGPAALTVTLKPSLQGSLPSGTRVCSLDLTLTLPAGVTIKADSNGQVLDGGVTASGAAAGSLAAARFTAGDAAHPSRIRMLLINATGFTTGEVATVVCDLAPGSAPASSDFSMSGPAVTDADSAPIAGLSTSLTAEVR